MIRNLVWARHIVFKAQRAGKPYLLSLWSRNNLLQLWQLYRDSNLRLSFVVRDGKQENKISKEGQRQRYKWLEMVFVSHVFQECFRNSLCSVHYRGLLCWEMHILCHMGAKSWSGQAFSDSLFSEIKISGKTEAFWTHLLVAAGMACKATAHWSERSSEE